MLRLRGWRRSCRVTAVDCSSERQGPCAQHNRAPVLTSPAQVLALQMEALALYQTAPPAAAVLAYLASVQLLTLVAMASFNPMKSVTPAALISMALTAPCKASQAVLLLALQAVLASTQLVVLTQQFFHSHPS